MPSTRPTETLVSDIHKQISTILSTNPAASASEAYIQNSVEFHLLSLPHVPRYFIRTGINYHGQKVQRLTVDPATGVLVGWNEKGHALATGKKAKMLLANHTILDREPNEPNMNDSKIGGGDVPADHWVRVEFKARGWLGKTKNLGGDQLEKDFNLLQNDQADLLVICLSETAHLKWRGEGPKHQVERRTGIERFVNILADPTTVAPGVLDRRIVSFEGKDWTVSTERVVGAPTSIMPGAEHFVSLCWLA